MWEKCFNEVDVKAVFGLKCVMVVVHLTPLKAVKAGHFSAGQGGFAAHTISKCKVFRGCYSSLVQSDHKIIVRFELKFSIMPKTCVTLLCISIPVNQKSFN